MTYYTLFRMARKVSLRTIIVQTEPNATGWLLIPLFYERLEKFIIPPYVGVQMIRIKSGMIIRLPDLILSK